MGYCRGIFDGSLDKLKTFLNRVSLWGFIIKDMASTSMNID
jgi:hypothetical protein